MALQFNSYLKGTSGLPEVLRRVLTGQTLRVYPSTVPFPTTSLDPGSIPGGHILQYTGWSLVVTGSTLGFSGGAGTSATTTAAGTLSWMAIYTGSYTVLTDSVGLTNSVLTPSTMTPGSGAVVTVSLALQMI